jgi:acetolactate synthase-1/2/3 large subunit
MIAGAKNPIFLLGLMASQAENSAALRELLKKAISRLPAPIRPPAR